MALLTNDLFYLEEKQIRVLSIHVPLDIAVVIFMDSATANPEMLKYSEIRDLPMSVNIIPETTKRISDKQKEHAKIMKDAISSFSGDWPAMADETYRAQRIGEVSKSTGFSRQTLYKQARRYWQGGQIESALYPHFNKCGRIPHNKIVLVSKVGGVAQQEETETRTVSDSVSVAAGGLVLKASDLANILEGLNENFLRLNGHTLQETVLRLHDKHYSNLSPTGVPIPVPTGQKPSYHQVYRFLKSTYTADEIAIARYGKTAFDKDRRGTTGSERDATAGPGDVYEVDAYFCDIYVTCEDRVYTAGRPILFLIRDKDTGLYVGMYIGMESPTWMGAAMAVLSIFEDKEELCLRHGIPYNEEDWPAHGLLPTRIAGDRGEAAAKASGALGENLNVAVTLYPGGRPDAKGGLEKSFNVTRLYFQTLEYGYVEPNSTHMEHVGKVGAGIKFSEFQKKMWEQLISHNNLVNLSARLSRSEILAKVRATPINLWNHRHSQYPNLVRRNTFSQVKHALLPVGKATITSQGFVFENRLYANEQAVKINLFSKYSSVEEVNIKHDPRSVNTIWVEMPGGIIYESTLSTLSKAYKDLTWQEASDMSKLIKELKADGEAHNILVKANIRHSTAQLRALVKAEKAKLPKVTKNAKTKNMPSTRDKLKKDSDTARLAQEALHAPAQNVISSLPKSGQDTGHSTPKPNHMDYLIQNALGKF